MRVREFFFSGTSAFLVVWHKLSTESELIFFLCCFKKNTRESYSHVLKMLCLVLPSSLSSSSFLYKLYLLYCWRLLTPWHPLQNIFLVRVHSCFLVWKHLFLFLWRWWRDEAIRAEIFFVKHFHDGGDVPNVQAQKLQSIKK